VRQKALSYFSAVLQVYHGSEEPFTAEGYELFLEVQRLGLHPDTEAIDTYLEINFNFHPSVYLHLKYISKSQMRWQPIPGGRNEDLARWMEESGSEIYYDDKPDHQATWAKAVGGIRTHAVFLKTFSDFKKVVGIGPMIQGVVQQAPWDQFQELVLPEIKPPPKLEIEAKGLTVRASKLGIHPKDQNAVVRNMKDIIESPLLFSGKENKKTKESVPVTHDMEDTVCMDLEMGSTLVQVGKFLTYAVGWRYKDQLSIEVAFEVDDLLGELMWRTIKSWVKLKNDLKLKKLYVYAHNGSRFDTVECIQQILTRSDEMVTDLLTSNGKIISVQWNGLVFRDSCLITMSSLSAAAISHGLSTLKDGLPHRYLQNCKNPQELLDRLHGQVTWTELEPYMDWFSECKDLQKRKAGRTWEQWRDEQPVRQHWVEHKDEKIDFLQKMKAYLATDVNLLWELVQKEGAQKAVCVRSQWFKVRHCRMYSTDLDPQ